MKWFIKIAFMDLNRNCFMIFIFYGLDALFEILSWPWCPTPWPWCPFKIWQIQGQSGLALKIGKFEACFCYPWLSGLPPNEVLPRLKERVLNFKQGMPIMTALRNPALRPRHWQEIQDLIGRHIVRDKNFTLGKFMDLQVNKKVKYLYSKVCGNTVSW